MENCRNIFNISARHGWKRFYGRHGWNPVSQFQEKDFERCTVLLYHLKPAMVQPAT